MKNVTLCFILKENKILLGLKKKGFGKGKYNGFGGYVELNESIEEATLRELREESGLLTNKNSIKKYAEMEFTFPNAQDKGWDQRVHVYIASNFTGKPKETEEMAHQWFFLNKIPYSSMWDADKYWLPLILEGKRIKANFVFNDDNETIKIKEIKEVKKFY